MQFDFEQFLEKRKIDIVFAALKLADRFGISGITTKRIAEEVGFVEGALYKHVRSKIDIFEMVLDVSDKIIARANKEILSKKLSTKEALSEWFRFTVSYLQDFPGVYRILFSDTLYVEDSILFQKFKKVTMTLKGYFEKIIAKGVAAGELRPDLHPDIQAVLFLGIIHTSFTLWNVFEERRKPFPEIAHPIFEEFMKTLESVHD